MGGANTLEDAVMAEVPTARDAYRRGVAPSRIVADLVERRGWRGIALIMFGMRAFELALRDCKGAEGVTAQNQIDPVVFDAYFIPLIEAARPRWDR